jgi:CRP-like cAMP-binding protein
MLVREPGGTVGTVLRVGAWLACCLGRGERAPIGPEDIARLVDEVGEQSYAAGTYVFREGDDAARVHVLRTGSVELSRAMGGTRLTVQLLRPGDVFGDVPLLLGEPEPFDARAVMDSTLLSMDAAALFRLLSSRPALLRRWMVSLADRMSGLQQRLIVVLAGSLESQLAGALLARATNGSVAMTQEQLAALLGVQRTSIQRVLTQLEGAGLVARGYGRIELLDPSGLATLIEGHST